ncbi:MAG: DUF2812 domain-containing protein [Anaerotignum sp.]|nr:DUF2812 domain-containing protein [Anaerotignum sp.]
MAEKRIKQLKRQMPLRDGLRAQAYFQDMARRGLFLDEIGYLYYYFREDEPKEIRYATQVFSEYPKQEELEEVSEKGWKMVCRWEKEYVFFTEDMTIPDLYDHLEIERLEVERQILATETNGKKPDWFMIVMTLIPFIYVIYRNGFNAESFMIVAGRVWHWIAILLFVVVFNFFARKRLKRKRAELEEQRQLREEGRWDDDDIDWRSKRARNTVLIAVVAAAVLAMGYYGCNMNEKAFDMPDAISYAELPVVRVEALQEGDWKRAGEPVDLSREGFGIRNGTDFQKNNEYRDAKFWSRVQNYGVEYKNLPVASRKVYMTQYMEDRLTGELTGMQTMYWDYRLESLATRKFEKLIDKVEHGGGLYSGAELDWTDAKREILEIPKGTLDELIVCKLTGEKGERLHIRAREGDQLMEMKYKGAVDVEKILTEISRVFASQIE